MAKFKENANMFNIADHMKTPMMHGHTCIELKDVRTGKRERIESDNTFMATTLAEQMKNFGIYARCPLDSSMQGGSERWVDLNYVRNLCGGVFLFKDAIPDNAKYMQAGNKMTANGSYNIVNNGNPPELGSWNSIESNIDGNSSAVLVWDWSTSQGNGQISSVCLTSEMGGRIGYGNASGYQYPSSEWYNGQPNGGYIIEYNKITRGNDAICFSYTKPNLTISKYRLPVTQMSIFGKKLKSSRVLDLTNYNINNILVYRISNDTIMVWDNKNVANNENFEFLLINIDDYTITPKTVVNTTGETLSSFYFTYYPQDNICVAYQITSNTTHKKFIINPTTSAVIRTDSYDYGYRGHAARWQENLYIPQDFSRIYDLVNNTDYVTNVTGFSNYRWFQYNYEYDVFEYGYDDTDGRNIYSRNEHKFFKSPLYLATINNLQESVTKQNTQTMKVTYTLTEV